MRLIDADRLMDSLKGNVLIDVTPELEDTIAQQPTAFDREKVHDELIELRNSGIYKPDSMNKYNEARSHGRYSAFWMLLGLSRKAGLND